MKQINSLSLLCVRLLMCVGMWVLVFVAPWAVAQSTEDGAVSVRFHTVGFGGAAAAPTELICVDGRNTASDAGTELRVPAFRRSAEYAYRGSPLLVFYDKEQWSRARHAGNGAEANLEPVSSVHLPQGASHLLLLFIPEQGGRYRIVALDSSEFQTAGGMARVFNATKETLAIKVANREPSLIGAGQTLAFEGNGVNLRMQVAMQRDGHWEIVASPMFGLSQAQRRTIFLVSSDSDFFKVQSIEGGLIGGNPLQTFSITE